jgi:hypothetical protein
MPLSVPGKVLNRILLERLKEAVDTKLRDQQAGFRRNRYVLIKYEGCSEIIETLSLFCFLIDVFG